MQIYPVKGPSVNDTVSLFFKSLFSAVSSFSWNQFRRGTLRDHDGESVEDLIRCCSSSRDYTTPSQQPLGSRAGARCKKSKVTAVTRFIRWNQSRERLSKGRAGVRFEKKGVWVKSIGWPDLTNEQLRYMVSSHP